MGRCPFDRCDGWCNGTGSCWDDSSADRTGTPGGTDFDLCAAGGHRYYGDERYDDSDESVAVVGRCYCGAQSYQPGGPLPSVPREVA